VTPVIIFPIWPFNLAETMGTNFMSKWVHWTSAHPQVRRLPLAVAVPHHLRLPPHWKLVEDLGQPVETFSQLSQPCAAGPVCFERVIGCRMAEGVARTTTNASKAWEDFRSSVVSKRCPEGQGKRRAANGTIVVAFTIRGHSRNIRNLDSLLEACRGLGLLAGRPVECKSVKFKNILEDVCAVQDIDIMVGIHGAQLMNALLMRPGSSLLEIRANLWWEADEHGVLTNPSSWPNTLAQELWLTNNTRYFFYGALQNESFPYKQSAVPGRDSDVEVSWPLLQCMLQRIATAGDQGGHPVRLNAGCSRAAA